MSKRTCGVCKNEVNTSDKFCIFCGSKLEPLKQVDEAYEEVFNSAEGIMVALLAKVAKSDGNISRDEAKFMGKVYDEFCKVKSDLKRRDIFKQILAKEKSNLSNVAKLCENFLSMNLSKAQNITFVSMLVELAYIGMVYSKEEENLIVKIVHNLDMDFLEYKRIVDEHISKEKSENKSKEYSIYLSIDECYVVLNIDKNVSDAELKKSYRKLARAYHSDILKGKDLPTDIVEFGDEKLKSMNFAYEKLKKYRNFR
ncbi:MAG: hypothetical protein COB07_08445 [Sulfurovum sp.]|nr:MAG: hypothetical protein COB07_08445 [Sulfurovum sp.]